MTVLLYDCFIIWLLIIWLLIIWLLIIWLLIIWLLIIWLLIHVCLASQNRDIGKQCRPRSDAATRGVWSGSTLVCIEYISFYKHGSNIK